MVQRKDCKYYYFEDKQLLSIDSPVKDTLRMPMCKINKMTVGGCREDCKWFESKQ